QRRGRSRVAVAETCLACPYPSPSRRRIRPAEEPRDQYDMCRAADEKERTHPWIASLKSRRRPFRAGVTETALLAPRELPSGRATYSTVRSPSKAISTSR